MAQSQFVLSPQAIADLQNLETYITEESGAARAEAVLARVYRSLKMLAYWPNAGRARPNLGKMLRSFPVPPWIVFYEPMPNLEGIHVLRVVDGRRDLDAVFDKAIGPK